MREAVMDASKRGELWRTAQKTDWEKNGNQRGAIQSPRVLFCRHLQKEHTRQLGQLGSGGGWVVVVAKSSKMAQVPAEREARGFTVEKAATFTPRIAGVERTGGGKRMACKLLTGGDTHTDNNGYTMGGVGACVACHASARVQQSNPFDGEQRGYEGIEPTTSAGYERAPGQKRRERIGRGEKA